MSDVRIAVKIPINSSPDERLVFEPTSDPRIVTASFEESKRMSFIFELADLWTAVSTLRANQQVEEEEAA